MATRRMLVDAIHPEETRIVVTNGNRLEEFDFESASRRQLRGNIYLAKVTRVEPSLQAAFVEYGGNRHGFLAFSEIHPDYYQIPVADREALLREDEESADEPADIDEAGGDESAESADSEGQTAQQSEAAAEDDSEDAGEPSHIEQAPANTEPVENVGGADVMEEVPRAPKRRQQRYKIQEVIKRRQVMLVQVVKEERGNKGAALTTYLSLAGRYSVLMPNTARGGGISRKITNAADRKRLKEITSDLDVPPGMGVILRTAGATRTKQEVKRDFEYLLRLWENVRSLTLRSQAPCLVYEEGSLIKRTIRDLYSKEIEEVFVAGESAFREAHDFMNMIMPSAAKNVQLYQGDQPLFSKYGIESQLDQMFSPQVTLPSGGYIVINPTEALVSIDVNSGRATKEHNIEDTALQTNLEAAEEISRQLRLRDLAGLIVIDFIDMMENRSNRAVERKLKDCLKNDRARIQVGRISHFGLMEMSRQRIRFGVIESSTHTCPVCAGTGLIRSVESLALMIMRHVEDHVMRRVGQSINVRVPTDVALYILNAKRNTLSSLEAKNALSITVVADSKMTGNQFAIEKGELRINPVTDKPPEHVRVDTASFEDEAETDLADEEQDESAEVEEALPPTESEPSRRNRRNRRRRGGNRGDEAAQRVPELAAEAPIESVEGDEVEDEDSEVEAGSTETLSENDEPRRRRRRGRRGGRRNRRFGEEGVEQPLDQAPAAQALAETDSAQLSEDLPADTSDQDAALMSAHQPDGAVTEAEAPAAPLDASAPVLDTPPVSEAVDAEASEPVAKPKRTRRRKTDAEAPVVAEPVADPVEASEDKPKRKPRTRKAKTETSETEAPPAISEVAAAPEAPAAPEATAPADTQPAPASAEAGSDGQGESADNADGESESSRRRRVLPPEEGVIVTSSANAPAEAEPKKKAGWWQRRLGLG